MKLLYLADIRFPMERANGIQTIETCHALARAGVDVELVVRRSDDRTDAACLEFFGLEPHPLLTLVRVALPAAPADRFSFAARALWKLISGRRRYDAVYTRDLILAELMTRAHVLHRRPVFFEAHTSAAVFAEERARLYDDLPAPSRAKLTRLDRRERRVVKHAAGIVSITHALLDALRERHGELTRARVVADGCRVPASLPAPPAGGSDNPTICYIGQLYPWKGVDLLVESMQRVDRGELVVVGGLDGEGDLERVRRLAADRCLAERVHFRGYLPPTRLAAERERASLFVIPLLDSATARLFTSPLKLFEAMASGRPIVASDLPSIREILTHEQNALLVQPGDAPALAAAITRLLDEPSLATRLAERAFEHAASFSWDARAHRIREFLAERS